MAWKFDNKIPIYLQIVDMIKLQIVTEQLKSSEKLPSVRDLAETAGVNPNTIQRALTELETQGLVYAVRTTGRYVTEDEGLIAQTRFDLAQLELANFITNMNNLGYKKEDLPQILKKFIGEQI